MQQKTAKANDIRAGDRVQMESGDWVTVNRIHKSDWPGAIEVDWQHECGDGGRAVIMPGQLVPVQRT